MQHKQKTHPQAQFHTRMQHLVYMYKSLETFFLAFLPTPSYAQVYLNTYPVTIHVILKYSCTKLLLYMTPKIVWQL